MSMIAFQPEFRPSVSTVYGPKDYRDFRDLLTEMDRILVTTGLEFNFVARHIALHPERFSRHTFQNAVTLVTRALRDATRTLIKAIELIRSHGIK